MTTEIIIAVLFGGIAFAFFAIAIFANWILRSLDHYDGEHW